jgi:Glycoside hydrolase family 2 C-terminal domain 5
MCAAGTRCGHLNGVRWGFCVRGRADGTQDVHRPSPAHADHVRAAQLRDVGAPQASNRIAFSVAGPGAASGVDNSKPIRHESYQGAIRSAFSGKALVIIRSTRIPGTLTLRVTSGSLTAASVDIATSP